MFKPLSIASLMSPLESNLESSGELIKPIPGYSTSPGLIPITPNTLPLLCTTGIPQPLSSIVLPSPPVSPENVNKGVACSLVDEFQVVGNKIRDPLLYPIDQVVDCPRGDRSVEDGVSSARAERELDVPSQDLFASTPDRLLAEDLVNKYMQSHMSHLRKKVNQPTREEYLLAASFKIKLYSVGGLKRTREEVDKHYWQAKRICGRPGFSATRKKPVKIAPSPAGKSPRRVITPVKGGRKHEQAKLSTSIAAVPSKRPRSILQTAPLAVDPNTHGSTGGLQTLIQRTKRLENYDYGTLLDFTPPTSILPANNPFSLRIDWTGTPLDLTGDPDRNKLHEAEIILASTLRLTCAAYLFSKRRIFQGYLQAYRNGKTFRKTDAQKVCNIDVNKASKLWAAYNTVGWFDRKYVEPFL